MIHLVIYIVNNNKQSIAQWNIVSSFADYERKFGPLSSDTFIPQTVRS